MTTNPSGTSGAAGSSWGQKIKGAGEVAHGVGESIRGQFFNAVDAGTGTGPGAPDLRERGRVEAEQGMSRMTGTQYGPSAATTTGTSARVAPGVASGATAGAGAPAASQYGTSGIAAGSAGGGTINQQTAPSSARNGVPTTGAVPQNEYNGGSLNDRSGGPEAGPQGPNGYQPQPQPGITSTGASNGPGNQGIPGQGYQNGVGDNNGAVRP